MLCLLCQKQHTARKLTPSDIFNFSAKEGENIVIISKKKKEKIEIVITNHLNPEKNPLL